MTQINSLDRAPTTVRYAMLLAPCIAQALIALDYAIVYVALPTVAEQLHLSFGEMQWVVSLYGLSFAALLLLGGSLCDRFGARRIFQWGMVLFLVASLLGGLASNGAFLLIARGGQGIAAALLQPAVLALIAQRFHGEPHHRALAIWSAVGTIGLVMGVMLGGILTELSWRTIFFINIPPGLLALWAVARDFLPGTTSAERQRNGYGAIIGCLAAGSLVWAMMSYAENGNPDYIANRLATVMVILFIVHERYARYPLLSKSLRQFEGLQSGWLSSALYMASVGSQFYAMTLYWQQTLQLDAVTTGLLFTPLALLIVVGNILYTRLGKRYSSAQLLSGGFACAAVGLYLLAVGLTEPLSWAFVVGVALSGIGHGLIFPAMFTVGLHHVPQQQQGRASALMVTSQYMAGAMMLAILSVLLGTHPDWVNWSSAFQVLAGAAAIGMMVAICAPKNQ